MPVLLPKGKLELESRAQQDIDNFFDRTVPDPGAQLQVQAFKRKYPRGQHRPTPPSFVYNCHGLTFAARRTAIFDPNVVKQILAQDDYIEVNYRDLIAGDIVVYYKDGDVEHSGIVVEVTQVGPRVLSKWGHLHEVIHMIGECEYDASGAKYFRVNK
jgi:hypothetical protein